MPVHDYIDYGLRMCVVFHNALCEFCAMLLPRLVLEETASSTSLETAHLNCGVLAPLRPATAAASDM